MACRPLPAGASTPRGTCRQAGKRSSRNTSSDTTSVAGGRPKHPHRCMPRNRARPSRGRQSVVPVNVPLPPRFSSPAQWRHRQVASPVNINDVTAQPPWCWLSRQLQHSTPCPCNRCRPAGHMQPLHAVSLARLPAMDGLDAHRLPGGYQEEHSYRPTPEPRFCRPCPQ